MVDGLADAEQELIGQSFERTVAGESRRGQRVERADALLQKLPRYLKYRLRKAVVETQLVRAGGVVDNELSRRYHGFAAVLKHAVHAAVCQAHQHEILAGACDPGGGAKHLLGAGTDPRAAHRADRRLRNRSPKRVRAGPIGNRDRQRYRRRCPATLQVVDPEPKNWCRARQPRWISCDPPECGPKPASNPVGANRLPAAPAASNAALMLWIVCRYLRRKRT